MNNNDLPHAAEAALPPATCSACLGGSEGSPINRLIEWRRRNPSEFAKARNAGQEKSEKVKTQRVNAFKARDKAQSARSRNPIFMKTPLHIRAKNWQLRDDKGRVHNFRNLADWIRKNPALFSAEDVAWKEDGKSCRAYDGLRSLRPDYKRPAESWKGWTWKEPNAKLRDAAD